MTTYQITTKATAQAGTGTTTDGGTLNHALSATDVAAGKYRLESEDHAAHRIARNRHLDLLDADPRFDGLLIDVEST